MLISNAALPSFGQKGTAFRAVRGCLPIICAMLFCLSFGDGAALSAPAAQTPSQIYSPSPSLAPGAIRVGSRETIAHDLDDYDDVTTVSIADPIEPWNRFWFRFNDIFYIHVARPVYNGWVRITPRQLRNGLNNFFHNLLFPTRFINSLLQFKFRAAGVEFGRFVVNTVSSAGFADVARPLKTVVPVDESDEDFGQTLGSWGIGQGFYIVWPLIGPSSLRDSVGRVGDWLADPIAWLNPWYLSTGTEAGFRFNALGTVLPTYVDLKSIAVDPYISMREAYADYRKAQIRR